MKNFQCFTPNFSLKSGRFMFRNGAETPMGAPNENAPEKKDFLATVTPEEMKSREEKERRERDQLFILEMREKITTLNEYLKNVNNEKVERGSKEEKATEELTDDIIRQTIRIAEELSERFHFVLEPEDELMMEFEVEVEGENIRISWYNSPNSAPRETVTRTFIIRPDGTVETVAPAPEQKKKKEEKPKKKYKDRKETSHIA